MAPLTAIHLCSGYGGFELALRPLADVRTVCHVERDAYAAAVLVERMVETRLDQAPIWDDLVTFDGGPWRGRVDLITAGFPCQPFSAAGTKRGVDDERWLWPDIARIIRDVAPRYVLLENVTNVIRHGLPEVLHDLASFGFDAEWGCLSAGAVGAPHERERFWLLAYLVNADGTRCEGAGFRRYEPDESGRGVGDTNGGGCEGVGERADSGGEGVHGNVDGPCTAVADPESPRWRERGDGAFTGGLSPDAQAGSCNGLAIAENDRLETGYCGGFGAPSPWPPVFGDTAGWERWVAEGGPQPVLRRNADGPPPGLADALHLGGNGLVPQCATEAFRQLLDRCAS